jgi:hypothetical protein
VPIGVTMLAVGASPLLKAMVTDSVLSSVGAKLPPKPA